MAPATGATIARTVGSSTIVLKVFLMTLTKACMKPLPDSKARISASVNPS